MLEYIENERLKIAFDFVEKTNKNIFLTGKAGTGKTTFLQRVKNTVNKKMIVVAPTGVAAINAGGVTIHSFFQLPFGPIIPNNIDLEGNLVLSPNQPGNISTQRFSRQKIDIIKNLNLLIIDEISMVRADILDGIDTILKRVRKNIEPFGGVQLLMIGDMQQLAPVVTDELWSILSQYYENCFFFNSRTLQSTNFVCIELTEVFRQTDTHYIHILNKIRDNKLSPDDFDELNTKYISNIDSIDTNGYITLTTHNYQSQKINDSKLARINEEPHFFNAVIKGEFPEYLFPTLKKLELKKGSQVMFVKNDSSPEKLYFNGKIGIIVNIIKDKIIVKCKDDKNAITVTTEKWENIKYEIDENTKQIKEKVIGTFTQYPLKLAWAITIHKSQGLTFDKIIVDAHSAFAFGQVYVALSRCRTMDGLILTSTLNDNCIITNSTLIEFNNIIKDKQPDKQFFENAIYEYKLSLLLELFDFQYIKKLIGQIKFLLLNKKKNSALYNNILMFINNFENTCVNNVYPVASDFADKIDKSISDNLYFYISDSEIQEVCSYVYEKLEPLFSNYFKNIKIPFAGKETDELIYEYLDDFNRELSVKINCLNICKSGFDISKFLNSKNKPRIISDKNIMLTSKKTVKS